MAFKRAVKEKSKLRLALFGPAGSGKTYTALAIAHGLGGEIALIDSERGSARKYAGRRDKESGMVFQFDVDELEESKAIEDYLERMKDANKYDVLIIDSLTHAWDELLAMVEKVAQTKFRGNSWAAWQEGTPLQRKLIDAILSFPGHIIATMRSKTEWTLEKDMETGKNRPRRIGGKPEQGKQIEYEFDLLMDLSAEHIGTVLKDRTGKFQDKIIQNPGVKFGQELAAWLNEGVKAKPHTAPKEEKVPIIPAAKASADQVKVFNQETKRLGMTKDEIQKRLKKFNVSAFKDLPRSEAADINEYLIEQEDPKKGKKK